jgi:UPF0755 protein
MAAFTDLATAQQGEQRNVPPAPANWTDPHPTNLKVYGGLVPFAALTPTRASALLASKLKKIGASSLKREALFADGGALSAAKIAGKSTEDLGIVVTGVNDQPEIVNFPGEDDSVAPSEPLMSVPLSAAALADEKAREARYGDAPAGNLRVAVNNPSLPSTHVHAFDASEGTRLDPLLNKTFDLSYAKDIPGDLR